jgi:hypothetical protein
MRYLVKYLRLTGTERCLLAEAVVLLGMMRLAILCMPFRYLAPYLGRPKAEAPQIPLLAPCDLVLQVGWAVQTAARRVPWQAVCLPQALAAGLMLRRRGIACNLNLGVVGSADLAAHAWVESGGVIVVGERQARHFTVIARFG